VHLQLGFQPLEKGESVRRRPRESDNDVALAEPAHLFGVGLDDRIAERDLAIADDDDLAPFAHRQNRRAVKLSFVHVLSSGRRLHECRWPRGQLHGHCLWQAP
jgi:hypothetical protein